MKKRIAVFAIESNKRTSQIDIEEFILLMNLLSKKYNFNWCQTTNSKWVRALADEIEDRKQSILGDE